MDKYRSSKFWLQFSLLYVNVQWIAKGDQADDFTVFPEKEFCQGESFQTACEEDEVVVITRASYGRVEIGRCVESDFGFLGCVHDVTPEMDALCSGQQSCSVSVSDKTFSRIKPCHKDLKSHLRVSYRCFKVIIPRTRCQYTDSISITQPEGYLSNRITEETKCGSTETPWLIKASSGQRVNITLLDFSYNHTSVDSLLSRQRIPRICKVYATIRETSAQRSTTVCGSQGRMVNVYTSTKNVVEVRILGNSQAQTKSQFLLHYEVIGCKDPEVPDGGWLKRSGSTALIGCEGGTTQWKLTCQGKKWSGAVGNCSNGQSAFLANVVQSVRSLPYGISIVLIIAIAVTVSCLILVIGVVCIKMRMEKEQREVLAKRVTAPQPESDPRQKYDTRPMPPGAYTPDPNAAIRENEYASMRLLRPGSLYDRENTVPSDGHDFGTMPSYRRGMYSPSEHIYESPETIRRDLGEAPGSPQYFDLDPQGMGPRSPNHARNPTCSHGDYCTCATGPAHDTLSRGPVSSLSPGRGVHQPHPTGNLSL